MKPGCLSCRTGACALPVDEPIGISAADFTHWLVKHWHKIEIFYLPSYSPEPSTNEMANADLKQALTKLAPARIKLQLVKLTATPLRSVQRPPERINSYFQHRPVRYSA